MSRTLTDHPTESLPTYAPIPCPRWERCNAGYCPALGGVHLPGEPVCLYLLEAVKPGGEARIRAALPGTLADAVLRAAQTVLYAGNGEGGYSGTTPDRLGSWRHLRGRLYAASSTGSRIESGLRLARRQACGFGGRARVVTSQSG